MVMIGCDNLYRYDIEITSDLRWQDPVKLVRARHPGRIWFLIVWDFGGNAQARRSRRQCMGAIPIARGFQGNSQVGFLGGPEIRHITRICGSKYRRSAHGHVGCETAAVHDLRSASSHLL